MSEPRCLLCGSARVEPHFYPPNRFNGKEFRYYRCRDCGSIVTHPVPTEADLGAIYGVREYAGLEGESAAPVLSREEDYPPFHYHRFQLQFFREAVPLAKGRRLLDFGCGNGFYLLHARQLGFDPAGVEYDADLAALIARRHDLEVVAAGEMESRLAGRTFDVIHCGHVLEHLVDPGALVERLFTFGHPETLYLFDGPLEANACLSRAVIDLGSRLQRKAFNTYVPQHLTFTTARSQRDFFERLGLKTLRFHVVEQPWPLPSEPRWGSPGQAARYLLSRLSIRLSGLAPGWGNLFHYAGRRG